MNLRKTTQLTYPLHDHAVA